MPREVNFKVSGQNKDVRIWDNFHKDDNGKSTELQPILNLDTTPVSIILKTNFGSTEVSFKIEASVAGNNAFGPAKKFKTPIDDPIVIDDKTYLPADKPEPKK